MRRLASVVLLSLCLPVSGSAQQPPLPVLELSLQGAYYPYYLTFGETNGHQLGLAAGLVIRPRKVRVAMELGASFVQREHTTHADSPHLRTLRALGVGEHSLGETGRTRVYYGAGISLLRIDAQTIDCGAFPLCNEWAHGDLTTVAPTGAVGIQQVISRILALQVGGRVYIGLARWDPSGHPMLWEFGVGLALQVP